MKTSPALRTGLSNQSEHSILRTGGYFLFYPIYGLGKLDIKQENQSFNTTPVSLRDTLSYKLSIPQKR